MAEVNTQRRLAAILAADVVGYSRLVSADENGTLSAFRSHLKEFIEPTFAKFNGRLFKTMGDGLLAEFASVVEAVECAVAFQEGMAQRNADAQEDQSIIFRIGINLGDVVVQDDDVFGDGVNVAARLEGLAEPGGICISRSARDQIRDKLSYGLEDWGEVEVKNISRPVRVFRLLSAPEDAGKTTARPRGRLPKIPAMIATAMAALFVVGIGLAWLQPWRTKVEAASVARMAYPLPDKPSIAVLPFANLSSDEDQEFFATGITEDIVTDISKVSGIFVVASDATSSYKGKPVKVGQVAEDLGVRYVLEGSVRRSGDKLRISAQLIDAIKGVHIWADRYDRNVKDVFAVQSEITGRVVKALAVTLKANEHDRVFQKYVANIDAYDAFLRARKAVDSPNRANIEHGEKLFQRAIELDNGFAGGYAGLAFNYSVKARFGYGNSRAEDTEKSLELAKKAIALDRNFAWSHIALASAYLAKGKTDLAVDAAREALAIQPGGYEENLFMGFYLQFAGESIPAVKHLELARDLSRVDTVRGLSFLAMAYFVNKEYSKSEATWKKRIEKLGPVKSPIGSVFMSAAQWLQDKNVEAAETTARYRRLNPKFRMSQWSWIHTYKSEEDRKRLYDAAISAGMPE